MEITIQRNQVNYTDDKIQGKMKLQESTVQINRTPQYYEDRIKNKIQLSL